MIKRIPCRVVSSVNNGQYRQGAGSNWPPMTPGDSSGPLGKVNADSEQECFPMGMFVDIVIDDK